MTNIVKNGEDLLSLFALNVEEIALTLDDLRL